MFVSFGFGSGRAQIPLHSLCDKVHEHCHKVHELCLIKSVGNFPVTSSTKSQTTKVCGLCCKSADFHSLRPRRVNWHNGIRATNH